MNQGNAASEILRGRPVSGVFQDFVEPLVIEWCRMQPQPSLEELNEKCRFPWMVWNAVVYKDFYPGTIEMDLLAEIRQALKQDGKVSAAVQPLVDFYTRRKRELFGEYRYNFGEFKFYRAGDSEVRCRAAVSVPKNTAANFAAFEESLPNGH